MRRGATIVAVLAALLVAASAGASRAQDERTPPGGNTGGVLKPPGNIDPGITRKTPSLPRRSTPVIHPRKVKKGRHGPVLVQPR